MVEAWRLWSLGHRGSCHYEVTEVKELNQEDFECQSLSERVKYTRPETVSQGKSSERELGEMSRISA